MSEFEPFKEIIFVTRPVLPKLEEVTEKLRDIWTSKWLTNNGPQHSMLEQELTQFLKVPYLLLFNNVLFTFTATSHVSIWNYINPIKLSKARGR